MTTTDAGAGAPGPSADAGSPADGGAGADGSTRADGGAGGDASPAGAPRAGGDTARARPAAPRPGPPPRAGSNGRRNGHTAAVGDGPVGGPGGDSAAGGVGDSAAGGVGGLSGVGPDGPDGQRARRRRPRRRGRRGGSDGGAPDQHGRGGASTGGAGGPAGAHTPGGAGGAHTPGGTPDRHTVEPNTPVEGRGRAGSGRARAAAANARARRGKRLRTVDETSAGGLVVDTASNSAALIGRLDRKGRLLWSLPKGHLEAGETAEQAAVREVAEETGINGRVLAPLGTIDYWFVAEDRRVHKTVHHFLMEATGGELCDEDVEVTEVAWVPLAELDGRLAYADERKLVKLAAGLLAESA